MIDKKIRVGIVIFEIILVLIIIIVNNRIRIGNKNNKYKEPEEIEYDYEWILDEQVVKFFDFIKEEKYQDAYSMLDEKSKEEFSNYEEFGIFIKKYIIDEKRIKKRVDYFISSIDRTKKNIEYTYTISLFLDELIDGSQYTMEEIEEFYDYRRFDIKIKELYPYNYKIVMDKNIINR